MSLLFDFFNHQHEKLIECLLKELKDSAAQNKMTSSNTLLQQKLVDLTQTLVRTKLKKDEDANIIYQLMIDELNQLIKRVNHVESEDDVEEVVKRMHHTKELFQRSQPIE